MMRYAVPAVLGLLLLFVLYLQWPIDGWADAGLPIVLAALMALSLSLAARRS